MTDKDPSKPDLEGLDEVWRVVRSVPDELDMKKLARRARFMGWRKRLLFGFEAVACLVSIGFYLGYVTRLGGVFFPLLGGLTAAFLAYYLYHLWRLNQLTWGRGDETAVQLVELQLRRAKASLAYMSLNKRLSYWGIPLFILAVVSLAHKKGSFLHPDMYLVYAVFGGVIVGSALVIRLCRPLFARKKAERDRLADFLKLLKEEE